MIGKGGAGEVWNATNERGEVFVVKKLLGSSAY